MLIATQPTVNSTASWMEGDIQLKLTEKLVSHSDPEIITPRLRNMQLVTEILELRQALNRERQHARIDPLTGIPNHRAYQQCLEEDQARCRRENKRLSLIVWDIDHFKSINDRHGSRGW